MENGLYFLFPQEEGIGYRGRLLISVRTEEGESASNEDIANCNVRGAVPISDVWFFFFTLIFTFEIYC